MNVMQFLGGLLAQIHSAYGDYWTALSHPQFTRFHFIWLLPVLLYLVALWGKRQITIRHSTLAPHTGTRSWSTIIVLGYVFLALSVINLDLALMGPTVPETTVQRLVQTRNVCVLNDNSGSMSTVLEDNVKELTDDEAKAKAHNDPTAVTVDSGNSFKLFVPGSDKKDEAPHKMTRAEGAQLAARYLIRHRMTEDPMNTDRFCLMRFDDDLYMMAPLTNDKLVLMLRTVHITENVGGGTNFIVALQKAYDYMMAPGVVSPGGVRVVIFNTDGYDSIDPDKRAQFIAMYKEAHIKLYVIGLGEGWKEGNELDLQKFADELHKADPQSGIVFRASNPGQMQKAMEKIDELERAQEIFETQQINREVDYAFILGALSFAILFFVAASLARRIP